MKLVILIPAYNEEESIAKVVKNVLIPYAGIDAVSVLVVDDGSMDQTALVAREAGAIVVSHPRNRGVGSAFNTGLFQALEMGADIMVNIDADGQFAASDIPLLIQPILSREADFVSGDRFTNKDGQVTKPADMSAVKFWGNKRMSKLISVLTDKNFNDVSCGFRAYSKEAMLRLNLTGKFTYTQESFLDLANKGLEIKTIPVDVKYFPDRKSRVAGNVLKYACRTANIIFRAYRDYNPLRFFGWLGLIPFVPGLAMGIFMVIHYLRTSAFSPYKAVGIGAIYLVSVGILFWIVGLLADMFVRVRLTEEQLLYAEKKRRYNRDS